MLRDAAAHTPKKACADDEKYELSASYMEDLYCAQDRLLQDWGGRISITVGPNCVSDGVNSGNMAVNGSIGASDIGVVKSNSGTSCLSRASCVR